MSAPNIIPPATTGGGAPVGGSGTPGTIAKFGTSTTVTNSVMVELGSAIGIGANPDYINASLDVNGNIIGRYNLTIGSSSLLTASNITSALSTDLVLQRAGVEAARIIAGGNFGIGTTNPLEKLAVSAGANDRIGLNVSGTVSTMTFGSSNPLSGGYRTISYDRTAATWTFGYGTNPAAASPSFTINNTGRILIGQNGLAALPVLADSTGVSGMYFPSAQTTAIVANGAIAATFSKVAGAGVALGGTIGLVFDASGPQQGIKLTATPANTDAQTLDAYNQNTSWSPTVTWGTGGTVTTTSATGAYTQIGNVVTLTVTIGYNCSVVPTGGSLIMDLPRPAATGFNQRPGTFAFNAWNGAGGTNFLSIGSASTTATLRVATGTGTADVAANLTVTANGALVVTATYLAS